MEAKIYIASTEDDYRKMVEYDKKCVLLTQSNDRSEIIKVAHIIDNKHYEYYITTKRRLVSSGISYKGKEDGKKLAQTKPTRKARRYEMVFYEED